MEAKAKLPEKHAASWAKLKEADGILVPGGFGNRGVEGKILAAEYARTHQVWTARVWGIGVDSKGLRPRTHQVWTARVWGIGVDSKGLRHRCIWLDPS